jgi:tagatose-1,6-bisphosphate aldolase
MADLSMGKRRALQRASTPEGIFAILALDHQDSLRRVLDLPDEDLIQFKMDVVGALRHDASGTLLDPVLGAAQAIQQGIVSQIGLLVELEKADYSMDPLPLNVEIDPDWNVAKIKRMGADGVKLFFYYNPDHTRYADAQDSIIRGVVAECAAHDIPLYAEPIMLPHPDGSDAYQADFSRIVIESARRIAALGVDVLKMEFPIDIGYQPDESAWLDACQQLTEAIDVPWVLLSAGVDFATFCRQVKVACDACAIEDVKQRRIWLEEEGSERMHRLAGIARHHAQPWTKWFEVDPVTTSWFKHY